MSVVHEFAVLPLVLNGHPARPQAALEQMFSRDSTRAAADQWTAADFWHHTTEGAVRRRLRLGGLLSYYYRGAA